MNFWDRYRNYISFWILGLSNNYSYVIMLSAAYDIITAHEPKQSPSSDDHGFKCNSSSTGAVLIADILPCLIIKLLAPFVFTNTNLRVSIVVILSALSFIITSFSSSIWLSYLGIVCASLSSGLGETTFLAYTSQFDSKVISYWSSGTGASGLLGSMSYAGLTTIGLSPNNTLLVMLFIPVLMAITFWLFIRREDKEEETSSPLISEGDHSLTDNSGLDGSGHEVVSVPQPTPELTYSEMAAYFKKLLKYMLPLGLVYFFEYFINQGLFELVYFPDIWLSHSEQYRWYNVDYQIGVLISRSSIGLIQIKRTYLLAIFQMINAAIVLTQIWLRFMPNIWFMLAIVLWEGLLGGLAYVNTFYRLYNEISQRYKEYSLSITTLSDSVGITLAGFTALPVHDSLCKIIKF